MEACMPLEFNKTPLICSPLCSQGVASQLPALAQNLVTLAVLRQDKWQGRLPRAQSGTVRFIDW